MQAFVWEKKAKKILQVGQQKILCTENTMPILKTYHPLTPNSVFSYIITILQGISKKKSSEGNGNN